MEPRQDSSLVVTGGEHVPCDQPRRAPHLRLVASHPDVLRRAPACRPLLHLVRARAASRAPERPGHDPASLRASALAGLALAAMLTALITGALILRTDRTGVPAASVLATPPVVAEPMADLLRQ